MNFFGNTLGLRPKPCKLLKKLINKLYYKIAHTRDFGFLIKFLVKLFA